MNIIKTVETYKSEYLLRFFLALILLLVCSQARLYIWEVPFTMQTFAVLLIGYFFDKKTIVLSILLSSTVFDTNLFKPALFLCTIGYKAGFILAGLFIGHFKYKLGNLLLFSLGASIILISGVSYLAFYMDSLPNAARIGLLPFVIPEIVKITMAVLVTRLFRTPIL